MLQWTLVVWCPTILFKNYLFISNFYSDIGNGIRYFNLFYLIFLIGIFGIVFNYKNLLITMLSVELMYLGIVSGFAVLSFFMYDIQGQIWALVILILAASESAVGLGLLIVLFKYGRSIDFAQYQELYG